MPEIDPNKKRALKSFRVIGFCTFAALAGALFGFDIGVISACFTMEVRSNHLYPRLGPC